MKKTLKKKAFFKFKFLYQLIAMEDINPAQTFDLSLTYPFESNSKPEAYYVIVRHPGTILQFYPLVL